MNPSAIITPVVTDVTCTYLNSPQTVTFGGLASYVQIANQSSGSIACKINGLASAQFTLSGNTVQIFNRADLQISSLSFVQASSGASAVSLEVIYGVIA
jgi:hypothetical protein